MITCMHPPTVINHVWEHGVCFFIFTLEVAGNAQYFQEMAVTVWKGYQTISWLRCDVDKMDKTLVGTLWCQACRDHEEKIISMKNYSDAWIHGSTKHKTSNVVDHVTSDQHKAALIQVRKSCSDHITNYSPIAWSLLVMDDTVLERMKRKFKKESYIMAKQSLAFKKYPALHELELRHGVELGQAYRTKYSAQVFIHYVNVNSFSLDVQILQFLDGW